MADCVIAELSSAAPPLIKAALLTDYAARGGATAWLDFPSDARSAEGGANMSDMGLNIDIRWRATNVETCRRSTKSPTTAATFIFPKHHHEHATLRSTSDGSKFALQRGALIFQKKKTHRTQEKPYALSLSMSAYAMAHRDGFPAHAAATCDEFVMLTLARGGVESGGVLVRCGSGRQNIRVFSSADGTELLSLEAHPGGLRGAARLHGNLHVEHATERADITLLARPVWIPRSLLGDGARNVFSCAADAHRAQLRLRGKIDVARSALLAILAAPHAKTRGADVTKVVATDISAHRRLRASALVKSIDAELAYAEVEPCGEFDVLANADAHEASLHKVAALVAEVRAVTHRRTVSNLAKMDALKKQLTSVIAVADNKAKGTVVKSKLLKHADILAVIPHTVECTTHAEQMAECAAVVRAHIDALDVARAHAMEWEAPFPALAQALRPGGSTITAINRAHATRIRREYPRKKTKRSCSCARRRAAWRKKSAAAKKKSSPPGKCGLCRKRRKPMKRKKCTAKKKGGSASGGGSRSHIVSHAPAPRSAPVAPAVAPVAADTAPPPAPLFSDMYDDDAELAAIAASLGTRHVVATADDAAVDAARAFATLVDGAAAAEEEEAADEAIPEQLLEAVELKIVGKRPLNFAAEWAAQNTLGVRNGNVLPLGGVVVTTRGSLSPFALMPLTDSLSLCEAATDRDVCHALCLSLAAARGVVPLLRVVTTRAETVHGVAMQVAALSVPRAAKRACDNADDDMRKRSLALLLGVLFGIDGAATVGVSAAAIDFAATAQCVACLDAPPQIRARPCGHASSCIRCWGEARTAGLANRCFLCRAAIKSTVRM